ncbi:phosphoribosylamine--glycine ligase [Candidatus Marinamargulisbacteria bacterium SCGC AG-414-C22]|nr:phosphoribosylamine--glycine ligase [Candidatus Marinamargulisbacteria bacterium SCGC AG-414-C22]
MKFLIVGSGGREHAIALSLAKENPQAKIYIAPGNAGTQQIGTNIPISDTDIEGLRDFAQSNDITITFVGPEAPLVKGIVNLFKKNNLPIIGPSQEAAQLEGSKEWAKKLMKKYHIPTAEFDVFTDYQTAIKYIQEKNTYPIVLKADGLAAGKGVTVAFNENEALTALSECFITEKFKDAGKKVVIEEFLEGEEASIFAFTDGETILPMEPAQDHKAIYNGDKGPNTGGMGAYCPAPIVTEEIKKQVYKTVFLPLLKAIKEEGLDYTGIVYAGLMINKKGEAHIVEFNVRFGDPETQVVLPRLKTNLATIFTAILNKELAQITLEWHENSTVGVVIASGGYPNSYEKDKVINGLDQVSQPCHVVHAGTKLSDNNYLTSGGRVVCVVGEDKHLATAIETTYKQVAKISFEKAYYRTDIGFKALPKGVIK